MDNGELPVGAVSPASLLKDLMVVLQITNHHVSHLLPWLGRTSQRLMMPPLTKGRILLVALLLLSSVGAL